MMYSGDDFYDDGVTSPLERPQVTTTAAPDRLLRIHARALWRSVEAPDFVEQVNATYDAYLAGGGNDVHYDVHWRTFSDAAKKRASNSGAH